MKQVIIKGKQLDADMDSYNAGKKAVTEGITIETCNFKNFGTRLKMESWELGFKENGGKISA